VNDPQVSPVLSPADFVRSAGDYEQYWLFGHLRSLLSRLNVSCVLDVGAHVGEFALQLRMLAGYDGWILSFEPVDEAHRELAARAGRHEHWRAFKLALGSRDEERPIKVAETDVFSSFLEPSSYGVETFGRMTSLTAEQVVPVRRLDSVAPEVMNGIPSERIFLKLDTQGWDLEVLRGAEKMLSRVVMLQTELSLQPIYDDMPSYTDILAFLHDKGFDLSGLFPVVRDQDMRLIELDCVLVRSSEVSRT
jgi:FkbM family methyltransferase